MPPSAQCTALRKDGQRCQRWAVRGEKYCIKHQGTEAQREALTFSLNLAMSLDENAPLKPDQIDPSASVLSWYIDTLTLTWRNLQIDQVRVESQNEAFNEAIRTASKQGDVKADAQAKLRVLFHPVGDDRIGCLIGQSFTFTMALPQGETDEQAAEVKAMLAKIRARNEFLKVPIPEQFRPQPPAVEIETDCKPLKSDEFPVHTSQELTAVYQAMADGCHNLNYRDDEQAMVRIHHEVHP